MLSKISCELSAALSTPWLSTHKVNYLSSAVIVMDSLAYLVALIRSTRLRRCFCHGLWAKSRTFTVGRSTQHCWINMGTCTRALHQRAARPCQRVLMAKPAAGPWEIELDNGWVPFDPDRSALLDKAEARSESVEFVRKAFTGSEHRYRDVHVRNKKQKYQGHDAHFIASSPCPIPYTPHTRPPNPFTRSQALKSNPNRNPNPS